MYSPMYIVNRPNPATGGVLGAEAPIKEASKRRWLPLTASLILLKMTHEKRRRTMKYSTKNKKKKNIPVAGLTTSAGPHHSLRNQPERNHRPPG